MFLLRQLIKLTYVDYIKYPFYHLILYMGDFVWHIKCIHMWTDASGNCTILFLADFEFLTFLANVWNFFTFLASHVKMQTHMKTVINFVIIEIKFCIFWGYIVSWVAKKIQKFQIWAKNVKNLESVKNIVLQFPEASDHIWMHLICQTKSPT